MHRLKLNYAQSISALNLHHGASADDIKAAYRNLAKQYHPDVYKLDGGEKFKKINAAYRYLKKHPHPTAETSSPRKQRSTYHPPQDDYARRRREYYRRKKAKEAQSRKQTYLMMIQRVKPFVLTVLVFNILLSLDYVLPTSKEVKVIKNYVMTTSRNSLSNGEKTFEYEIIFNDNESRSFRTNKRNIVNKGENYTLSSSFLFGTSMNLIHHKTQEELTPPFGVYNIFGVIIPFVFLLQYLYFYRVKNFDLRFGLVAFMLVAVLMQISLTFF